MTAVFKVNRAQRAAAQLLRDLDLRAGRETDPRVAMIADANSVPPANVNGSGAGIAGVENMSVSLGPDGLPIDVEVSSAPDLTREQLVRIVRDVRSLLATRYDMDISAESISVLENAQGNIRRTEASGRPDS